MIGAARPRPGAWGAAATAALVWAAAGAVAYAAAPAAYRAGPPAGHTGGFGEPTCVECHFGAPVDEPPGELVIRAPARFVPGEEYTLRVVLRHPDMAAAGFQLSARFADPAGARGRAEASPDRATDAGTDPGPRANGSAGRMESVDARTRVELADGVQYAVQTDEGAILAGGDSAVWALRWRAPDAREAVVLHAAGNAANDDASEFGDRIYTASASVLPRGDRTGGELSGGSDDRPGLLRGGAPPNFRHSPIQWRQP